jgi:C1A family cysteine protease
MSALRYGWHVSPLDARDQIFQPAANLVLPHHSDLRPRMPAIYDQGNLGSCTGNAIAAAVQFDQDVLHADFMPSRLFIYFNERFMEGTITQDAGANIRDGIKSINRFGVCAETLWPYDISRFAIRPSPAAFSAAVLHKSLNYQSVPQDLSTMKSVLVGGVTGNNPLPIVIGFSVFDSFESTDVANSGIVNLPAASEQMIGGHAVLIVGYDDASQRFIVRNSWGFNWGQSGYFTIPYAYFLNPALASDLWVIKRMAA